MNFLVCFVTVFLPSGATLTEEGGRGHRRAEAAEPEEGSQAPGGRRPRGHEVRHFSVQKPFVVQLRYDDESKVCFRNKVYRVY